MMNILALSESCPLSIVTKHQVFETITKPSERTNACKVLGQNNSRLG